MFDDSNAQKEKETTESGAWGAHLLLLQSLLGRVYVLLHRHVDELVLGLGLHHAGALLPHPLDGLGDVDVAVQTWSADQNRRGRQHQEDGSPAKLL